MISNFKIVFKLVEADLEMRDKLVREGKLNESYHSEMEKIHLKNADILQKLILEYGFPFEKRVGKEIADACWLIVQHSISKPSFMRYCLQKMNENLSEANKIHLAYLTDRIYVFEDKPQLYGTQFDWNENGELESNISDNIDLVNQRRLKLGLNTLEEQTKYIQQQAKDSNETKPRNFEEKQKEYELWKKRVGWI